MNKQQVYDRIQALSYELDLMYEDPEENAGVIFEFENKKAKLEVKLEHTKE